MWSRDPLRQWKLYDREWHLLSKSHGAEPVVEDLHPRRRNRGKRYALRQWRSYVVDGATCRLATLADRVDRRGFGSDPNPPLIDAQHRTLLYWKQEKRRELVDYLAERVLMEDGPFWKLAQALFEVLPHETEDWKLVSALLGERQTLRSEARQAAVTDAQQRLFQA